MNTRLLTLARAGSRNWWYHKRLREEGDLTEARKREHRSTRGTIKNLRACLEHGYPLVVSGSGHWWYETHYEDSTSTGQCSGYGHGVIDLWRAAGAIILHTEGVAYSTLLSTVPTPRPSGYKYFDPHWDCTFPDYIQKMVKAGARVENMPNETHRLAGGPTHEVAS